MKMHRTVTRVVSILELAAGRSGGVQFSEVQSRLKLPKSSAHDLLGGLVALGYLQQSRPGLYELGPAVSALLHPDKQAAVIVAAREPLVRLVEQTKETAVLGVRVGTNVAYIHEEVSTNPIRYSAPLHARRSLLTTAMGKALLINESDDELRRLYAELDEGGDPTELLNEMKEVRRRGVAFNHGNVPYNVAAASAPIFGPDQEVVAAVSVGAPRERIIESLEEVGAAVVDAATEIAARLNRKG